MNSLFQLNLAKNILLSKFAHILVEVELSEEHFRLKLVFERNQRLYIRYNDYNEYSYQFFLSFLSDKFIRYDNFDDHWIVPTRPHHCHTLKNEVIESPMTGEPKKDMILLVSSIQKYI